jgi:hypothetical protein
VAPSPQSIYLALLGGFRDRRLFLPFPTCLCSQNAGVIGDPYYRYNDVAYRWVAFTDWSYSRRFAVPEDLLSHTEVLKAYPLPQTVFTQS